MTSVICIHIHLGMRPDLDLHKSDLVFLTQLLKELVIVNV